MSLKVIVTGGRRYGELTEQLPLGEREYDRVRAYREVMALYSVLNALNDRSGISHIMEGGCPTGTDRHARAWAERRGIGSVTFLADWRRDGRKAGPLRNARMIAEADADLVVATPGGKGTADCVRRAKAAEVTVVTVHNSPLLLEAIA